MSWYKGKYLMETIEYIIQTRENVIRHLVDKDLRIGVRRVNCIAGVGVVVVGRIIQGTLKVG